MSSYSAVFNNCSRFVGESEGALRQTFAEASENAPCLIVFDEVDTLCPRRDQAGSEAQRRVVSTMLALLDGIDAQEQVGRVNHSFLCSGMVDLTARLVVFCSLVDLFG